MPSFTFRFRDAVLHTILLDEIEAFEKAQQLADDTRAQVALYRRGSTGNFVGFGSVLPSPMATANRIERQLKLCRRHEELPP